MKSGGAVALFSGGLDSILACRLIKAQGIPVHALKFVTPFFDDKQLLRKEQFRLEVRSKFGIDVHVVDLARDYLEMLRNPAHGFGKHFNPCIDCKIFMLKQARRRMADYGATFLITGEVLGQRPMSQRRDTLRVIERDSGCEDILLRPLCAQLLKETRPEREGLVDRSRLRAFSGRGRKLQMELAKGFGITDYPSPAGGCILTDPNLGRRIRDYYQGEYPGGLRLIQPDDIRLLLVGRQFRLPGGYWFVLGRNQEENEKITGLAGEGDWLMQMTDRQGPTGLLRRAELMLAGCPEEHEVSMLAAGLVVQFGKKTKGRLLPAEVVISREGKSTSVIARPLEKRISEKWRLP